MDAESNEDLESNDYDHINGEILMPLRSKKCCVTS